MGNSQNCIRIKDHTHKIIDDALQSPYNSKSFSNSIHYEEGNINILIKSKSSFFQSYSLISDENNDFFYEEKSNRKFSENPESFEIEIKNLLEKLLINFSEYHGEICLNLEGKYLTKQSSLDIMNFLGKAKNLDKLELILNNVYLNDEKFSIIINSLQKDSGILDLNLRLSKNHLGYLSGKLISHLISNLYELKSLQIDLSYNPDMSGNGLEDLAESFALLHNLTDLKLDFQATKINSSDLFFLEFKESLMKMPNLLNLSLDFSKNFLKSNILSLFIAGLQNLSNLQVFSLNLSYNNLQSKDLYDLSSKCSEFTNLSKFNLVCNECGLSLSEYEIISLGLARLPKLQKINLDLAKNYNFNKNENFLVDYINPEKAFLLMRKLKLNLSFNLIQEINYENFSFLFLCMKNLNYLDIYLRNNTIDCKGLENLMYSLGRMKFLKSLKIDLKDCDMKNTGFEIIGNSLSHIKSLKYLSVGFQTISCNFRNLMVFFKIVSGLSIEKINLGLGEKIFHRDEIKALIDKLMVFKILKQFELVRNASLSTLNNSVLQSFKNYLDQKKKMMLQVYALSKMISNKKIVFEIIENIS